LFAKAPHYLDPLDGVEENLAYNAFLVGRSLLGMRVADVLAAVTRLRAKDQPRRDVLCARRDAALLACLAGAVARQIDQVACEDMLLSFWPLFKAEGLPINAASILPGVLQKYGDIDDVIAQIAPRRILIASGTGELSRAAPHIQVVPHRFSTDPRLLAEWLRD
jgi:hypothetical protein